MANKHFQSLRPDIIVALPYPLSLLCELKYFSLTQTSLSANWWLEEPTHTSNKPQSFASPKLLPMDNEEEKNDWTNGIIYTGWRAFVSENRLAFQTSPHLALFVAVKQFWWHNVKSTKQSILGPTRPLFGPWLPVNRPVHPSVSHQPGKIQILPKIWMSDVWELEWQWWC